MCRVLTAQICLWDMISNSILQQRFLPKLFYSCAPKEPEDQKYFSPFVTLPQVRRAIHVGNLTFHSGVDVEKHLLEDVMKSIKPWLGVLMDNYRVSGFVSRQAEQMCLKSREKISSFPFQTLKFVHASRCWCTAGSWTLLWQHRWRRGSCVPSTGPERLTIERHLVFTGGFSPVTPRWQVTSDKLKSFTRWADSR